MLRYILLVCSFQVAIASAQSFKKIHDKAIVIDTHNDILSSVSMKGMKIDSNLRGTSHSDLQRFCEGGVDIQVFSIFCDERYGKGAAFSYANREIDSLYAVIDRNPDRMMLVKDPADLKEAVRTKKLGAMIGVEGGHMIEEDLANLESFYQRGARYLTLTWNNSVSWASSGKDETEGTVPNPAKGLNEFGKQVISKMNELGMMVDVSHVGEQTFYDALKASNKPVIASHSCAWHLCPHFRTMKDEQIRAVRNNGGVIFVNFYSGFVDSNYLRRVVAFHRSHQTEVDSLKNLQWPQYQINEWMSVKYASEAQALRPPISMLIDHIDHIVKIAGINHVGLGSDFDGIESAPQGLDDVTNMPLITQALLQRGYSRRAVKKILGGNFIRVFEANSKK